jgi:hypothetical protein
VNQMKKALLTGIAVLFLATGAAHAEEGDLIGIWNCRGVRVEFRKLMVHELRFLVKGKEIDPNRVDWDQPGEKIILKLDGKRCQEVK